MPFENEIGNTSVGKVIFERGSIQIDDPKAVRLLLEHDAKSPIGRMKSVEESDSGIFAEFKVANTTKGTDSLIEASENLRSGLSVGVEVLKGKNTNGIYRVSAARLMEVSLVQAAAFSSAAVTSVAASNAEAESTETKTENEEIVENTTPETTVATTLTPARSRAKSKPPTPAKSETAVVILTTIPSMFRLVDRYSNLPCLVQSILRAIFFETQNLFREYHAHSQGKWELLACRKYGDIFYPGTNVRVVAVPGLTSTNRIVCTYLGNLFYGTDLLSDEEQFELFWSRDNDEVRFQASFKAATQLV